MVTRVRRFEFRRLQGLKKGIGKKFNTWMDGIRSASKPTLGEKNVYIRDVEVTLVVKE